MVRPLTVFSFDYPPNDGGISRLCAAIVEGLSRRGVAVSVLAQAAGDASERPAPPRVPEVRLGPGRPRREIQAWRLLRRERLDCPVLCGLWYPEGLITVAAGVKRAAILAHGSELLAPREVWRAGWWRTAQRRVLQGATLVVANSEFTRRLVLEVAPEAHVAAVPLAVDHRRFSPGDRHRARARFGVQGKLVVGTVARLNEYKGHDVVFKALAALEPSWRERLVYLVAGQGPAENALRCKANEAGVAHLVRWLGYVPEADLPELYRAMDLFVLCTRENRCGREVEGFGLVFLEAQACGVPVVGARTGGIPEAVREGEGGWLISQDDAGALVAILRALVKDPASFRQAGLAARHRIERDCTWEHYLDRFTSALASAGIDLG